MFGNPGGQGWSPIIGYADEYQRSRQDLRVHEHGHVVQEMLFALLGVVAAAVLLQFGTGPVWSTVALFAGGPLFALVYGLMFAYEYVKYKAWLEAYRHIPFEEQAYEIQRYYLKAPDDAWGSRG